MDDNRRLGKIASNLAEEDRRKQLGTRSDVRRDIQETLGSDVAKHEALVSLAEKIWLAVPTSQKAKFTAEDWRKAINDRCRKAISAAEVALRENAADDMMYRAKVKTLHATFAAQVHRAMHEVSEKLNRGRK
ncbi:MAG: hypothetical protein HQL38_01240 [Alphaproteobacteria bacterium]|nr:hypothetical protein [Alphaproteobacteria bacterium]MBF0391279.1 hypothetical protein [Alphaproteobacteria bacterium]